MLFPGQDINTKHEVTQLHFYQTEVNYWIISPLDCNSAEIYFKNNIRFLADDAEW